MKILFLLGLVLAEFDLQMMHLGFLDNWGHAVAGWYWANFPHYNPFDASSKNDLLMALQEYWPWLKPHHSGTSDPNAIQRNHYVDVDMGKSLKEIAEENNMELYYHHRNDLQLMQFGNQSQNTTAPIVYLQHGMFDTADAWAVNHANDSTAEVLAKEGYDVWLGAARGTIYSRSWKADHFDWQPTEFGKQVRKEYFDFGIEQM